MKISHICTHIHIHTQAPVHTDTYTNTHTHTHTHTHTLMVFINAAHTCFLHLLQMVNPYKTNIENDIVADIGKKVKISDKCCMLSINAAYNCLLHILQMLTWL